jgi:replicative DNA helicase
VKQRYSKSSEKGVLSCVILDNKTYYKLAAVKEEAFSPQYRPVVRAMKELHDTGRAIDIITLDSKLPEMSLEFGELACYAPSPLHIDSYISEISDNYKNNLVIQAINDAEKIVAEKGDALSSLIKSASMIQQSCYGGSFVDSAFMLNEAYEGMANAMQNGVSGGIASGYSLLDKKLSGFHDTDLIILAARPSLGKTSFAVAVARNIAKQGKSVGFFSLEVGRDQLMKKIISMETDIPAWKLRTCALDASELNSIQANLDDMSKMKFYVDDTASIRVEEMMMRAESLKQNNGLDFIIVDYLQLITGTSGVGRVEVVSDISRSLKILAKELHVPVLALSQLSRGVESREDNRPRLSDLRESGSIEQDADIVLFLWQKWKKDNDYTGLVPVTLSIAKHRNGPLGEIELFFDKDKVKFIDAEIVDI